MTDGINGDAWIGSLNNSDTGDIIWKRVCTTTVADAPETVVTLNDIAFGMVRYYVMNGMCQITFENFSCNSNIGEKAIISESIPKCSINGYPGVMLYDIENGEACGYVYATAMENNLRYVKHKESSGNSLYGSFSYAVLEE